MKLLIITQKVDTKDSVLSFFHYWIESFSKHFEKIVVICLYEGAHDLPHNVEVYSLGKEEGKKRITYIYRLLKYSLKKRKEYDAVFVHMNQEYLLVAGLLWRALGKTISLWRNHYAGNLLTDIASYMCNKVFCTSKHSYTSKYKHTVFMPVGVSETMFTPIKKVTRKPHSVLSFGRISPSKKIEQLIEAFSEYLGDEHEGMLTVCGETPARDIEYKETLKRKVSELKIEENVEFKEGVPYEKAPEIYSRYDVCVNQSPSGMFDKTIFEAMLCETLVLSCNENLRGEINDLFLFKEDDVLELTNKLKRILTLSEEEKTKYANEMKEYAKENHSLDSLARRLKSELEPK